MSRQRYVVVMRTLVVAPADMQPDLLARDVAHRLVDRGDHHLDEVDEIGERAILVGRVAFEREVRAIELQEESVAHDRLVFDLQRGGQRIEITLERVVVLVLHDRRDDAGRWRREECFDEPAVFRRKGGAEVGALGFDQCPIDVADRPDRFRQMRAIGDLVGGGDAALERRLVLWIGVEIGVHRARADATEAGQAVAHVEHERLARLLAVVDHVEPGLDLLADDRAHGGAALRRRSRPHRPPRPPGAARKAASAQQGAAGSRHAW